MEGHKRPLGRSRDPIGARLECSTRTIAPSEDRWTSISNFVFGRDVRRDQNRHEVVDESSIHERSSNPSWPRVMRSRPRGQTARAIGLGGEALTGVHAGQVSSPDIRNPGLPTLCPDAEGNIGWRVIASANRSPRGPRPCACVEASCARTGRSHGHSLDMAQRVAWARPRP